MFFAQRDRAHDSTLHRRLSIWLASFSILGLLVPVVADAAATCSVMPEDPGLGPIDPSTLRLARVDGEDLLVDIDWSATASASMQLWLDTGGDEDGQIVASWGLASQPESIETVRLDGALSAVPTFGFTYRLRLVDDAGVADSTLGFGLAVDCPKEGCRYRVLDGIGGADLPRIPLALWQALEAGRARGERDLFAYIRAHHPELERHLPGLAWQMAQTVDGDPSKGCSCSWIQIATFDPYFEASTFGSPFGNPPTHIAGGLASGAGHMLLGQTYRTIQRSAQDLLGTTEFGMVTFCTRRSGSRTVSQPTEWPSTPTLTVEEQVVEACDAPCTPKVRYITVAGVCARGFASAADSPQTHANAWAAGSILLDGQMLIAMNKAVSATPEPFSDAADKQVDYHMAMGSRSTTSGLATITGVGSLDLLADNLDGGYDAYVLGGSTFGYRLAMDVPDGCPGVASVSPGISIQSNMDDGGGQGGAVLRSWETVP